MPLIEPLVLPKMQWLSARSAHPPPDPSSMFSFASVEFWGIVNLINGINGLWLHPPAGYHQHTF